MSVDTHKAVKALMGVGFNEAQAETLIETVSESHDAIASKGDLETLGQQAKADFEALGRQTKAGLLALEHSTEAKLRELELRMTIRLGTMIFAASGLIIAILKLFP